MNIYPLIDPYALRQDGSKPLTANWDAGIYSIKTSRNLIIDSDIYGLKLGDDEDIKIYSNGAGKLYFSPNPANSDIFLYFVGNDNTGQVDWMNNEEYFKFHDDIFMQASERIYFRNTNASIYAPYSGELMLDCSVFEIGDAEFSADEASISHLVRLETVKDLDSILAIDATNRRLYDTTPAIILDWNDPVTVKTSLAVEGRITVDGTMKAENVIKIKERAAAIADSAGYGQLWVKNTTPCELWFTDDAGTDTQIV